MIVTDREIFNQTMFHFSSSEEKIKNEDKSEYLEWVIKNNLKAKEIIYGSRD